MNDNAKDARWPLGIRWGALDERGRWRKVVCGGVGCLVVWAHLHLGCGAGRLGGGLRHVDGLGTLESLVEWDFVVVADAPAGGSMLAIVIGRTGMN